MPKLLPTTTILLFALLHLPQQNNRRHIYIFTSNAGNASFITQKSLLAKGATGLKERDILVHEIIGLKANEAMFKKYKATAKGFTFILIGKDGGEKLRSNEAVGLEKLYAIIDAMPMRQEEMKRQGKP